MEILNNTFQGLIDNVEFSVNSLCHLEEIEGDKELTMAFAFVRSTGVNLLPEHIDLSNFNKKTAYIGVNNNSTSIQGIHALGSLDINTYVVNTNRRESIFHPKIILSRGAHEAVLITGSANLTGQGMTRNLEHTIVIKFDLGLKDDKREVDKIENSLNSLPTIYPENVLSVSAELLEKLLVSGQLENEEVYSSEAETKGKSKSSEKGTKIPLPKRPKSKNTSSKKRKAPKNNPALVGKLGQAAFLVWKKNKLSKSDAQIANTKSTNVKGYMTMGNKSYRKAPDGTSVDNKTYMKDDVFGDLGWTDNAEFERKDTRANFELFIDGNKVAGYTSLLITDKASREPSEHGHEDQKQPTTALHVCGFGKIFQNTLGKNLELYKIDTNHYQIKVS